MLPKTSRLNLKSSFKEVAAGLRRETPHLVMFIKKAQLTSPLVGIALKKAQFNKAHLRNRAKRLSSKAVESLFIQLSPDLKLIIMPKPPILKISPQQIVQELERVSELFK